MKWVRKDLGEVPVKSWCSDPDEEAMRQIANLANHPAVFGWVALMPDCHVGYGMPIGAVIACKDALIPNAVGVDIGCGMCAVRTNIKVEECSRESVKKILDSVKRSIPLGEGKAHKNRQASEILDERSANLPGGVDKSAWDLAYRNLGTLGGGNHFIEIQRGDDGFIWLMIHSGSRNLGHRIAEHYYKIALELNERMKIDLPDRNLAFLPLDSKEGESYKRDMNFALKYARENRKRIMDVFKREFTYVFKDALFDFEVNIHHNYAAEEEHLGEKLWIHRKGATSAKKGETGIIPGSMGTPSYIVEGLGNQESFQSCSHGAGRRLGRAEACRTLDINECKKAMNGIVFDGFKARGGRFGRKNKRTDGVYDLEEAPQAYKNIEDVINSELDLITPLVKLYPLGVLKG